MKNSYDNYCHICGNEFSITSPKNICKNCDLPVCKEHSLNNKSSICDFCNKEKLLRSYHFSNKDLRDRLKNELSEIDQQNEINKSVLIDQNIKIKQFRTNLKNLEEKIKIVSSLYESKIMKEIERNEIFQENYNNIKKSADEMAFAEETLRIKIESLTLLSEDKRMSIEKKNEESLSLEIEYSDVKERMRSVVPIKTIKNKICKLCLHKTEYYYRSTFDSKILQRETFTNKPCCCNLI